MPVEPVRHGRRAAATVVLLAAVLAVLLAVLSGGGAEARSPARPQCTGVPACTLTLPASGAGSGSGSPSASPSVSGSASASSSRSATVVPPPASKVGRPWYDSGSVQALGGGALAVMAGLALLVLLRREPERVAPVARHAFPAPGGPPTVVDPAVPAPAAASPPVPRPAELHRATVATDLHPQGYVEIDEGLYRAIWSEPGEPPPDPGEPVEVGLPDIRGADRDADVLLAFPQSQNPHRRHHA